MFTQRRSASRQRRAVYAIIAIALLWLLGDTWHVFASGGSESARAVEDIADKIIKFASWGWIFFAIVAGKLMTNDFVYGSILHLDVNLRQIWQVMRSFSNFALGFIFVAYILKSFFSGSGELKQQLPMIIVSAILVQASRFIMAILIDLSTISISAISSLPLQVLDQQRNEQQYSFQMYKRTYIDQSFSVDMENTAKDKSNLMTRELEDILPKADSVSGPLIFLGASVLHTLDYNFLTQEKLDIGATAVIILLKAFVLLMFFVPIVALVVINMMRIFRIWMRIIMSPFIVIDHFLLGKKLASRSKIFDVGSMLALVFQPVAVVWLMSVGLILVVGMASIITGDNDFDDTKEKFQQQLNYKTISDNTAQVGDPDIGVAYVRGSLFESGSQYVGGFLGQMILFVFVIMLLWAILKAANSFSDITKSAVESVYSFAEGMMQSTPIVPFKGWATSVGALGQWKDQYMEQMRSNTTGKREADEAERRTSFLSGMTNAPARDIRKKEMDDIAFKMKRITRPDGEEKMTAFVDNIRAVMKKSPKLQLKYGASQRFTQLLHSTLQDDDVLRELARNGIISPDQTVRAAYKANPADLITKEPGFAAFISNALETWTVDRNKKVGVPNLKAKVFSSWSVAEETE